MANNLKNTDFILSLLFTQGIGLVTVRKLIDRISNNDNDFSIEENKFIAGKNEALRIRELCLSKGIKIISYFDVEYPSLLRKIEDYPPILYYRGDIDILKNKCAAIVGKREASEYGKKSAFRISQQLSAKGICIVSGLALGIDSEAHKGCLSQNGKTVAVLAHSIDFITPKHNETLAEEIVSKGGLLISEHPPLTMRVLRKDYVLRNRIQSGISYCSILVESGREGGSIRQAEYTFHQGRKLFVVMPKKITDFNSDFDISGSHHLIEEFGATAIYSKDDYPKILSVFE